MKNDHMLSIAILSLFAGLYELKQKFISDRKIQLLVNPLSHLKVGHALSQKRLRNDHFKKKSAVTLKCFSLKALFMAQL